MFRVECKVNPFDPKQLSNKTMEIIEVINPKENIEEKLKKCNKRSNSL